MTTDEGQGVPAEIEGQDRDHQDETRTDVKTGEEMTVEETTGESDVTPAVGLLWRAILMRRSRSRCD